MIGVGKLSNIIEAAITLPLSLLSLHHPLAPSLRMGLRGRTTLLVWGGWVGGVAVALPPLLGWGRWAGK